MAPWLPLKSNSTNSTGSVKVSWGVVAHCGSSSRVTVSGVRSRRWELVGSPFRTLSLLSVSFALFPRLERVSYYSIFQIYFIKSVSTKSIHLQRLKLYDRTDDLSHLRLNLPVLCDLDLVKLRWTCSPLHVHDFSIG